VRPGTHELDDATNRVILWVNVEEALYRDTGTGGVFADGADVVYPDAVSVIALVGEAIDNVEVVVDALVVCGKEGASPFGAAKVREVDNVSDGTARRSWSDGLLLVKLVVEQDVLVPVALSPPALVAVGGAGVGKRGDDLRGRVAVLQGRIVHGDGVLVVADADVASTEPSVGAVVRHTLSIVDVSVLASATRRCGFAGVGKVNVL